MGFEPFLCFLDTLQAPYQLRHKKGCLKLIFSRLEIRTSPKTKYFFYRFILKRLKLNFKVSLKFKKFKIFLFLNFDE